MLNHIAYCFDTRYAPHMGASLTSLLLNYRGKADDLQIHLVTDRIDSSLLRRIDTLGNLFRAQLCLWQVGKENLETVTGLPKASMHQFSPAIYYRLLLPMLLPNDIHKILYLDADTIVLGSVHQLFEVDLGCQSLAAVGDYAEDHHRNRLGLRRYFNSGVMLIDLQRWRQESVPVKCFQWTRSNPGMAELGDQCAINVVLHGQIKPLERSWNAYAMSGKEADLTSASIVHYIGRVKPWQCYFEGGHGELYWRYLRVSPWRDFKAEEPRTLYEMMVMARLLARQGKALESAAFYELICKNLAAKLSA